MNDAGDGKKLIENLDEHEKQCLDAAVDFIRNTHGDQDRKIAGLVGGSEMKQTDTASALVGQIAFERYKKCVDDSKGR